MMANNTEKVLDKFFKKGHLPPSLKAKQDHAYYINYTLTAGKFFARGNLEEANNYLTIARKASPEEFTSLQTFISFLKIYVQTGGDSLIETGPSAIFFLANQTKSKQEQQLITSFGFFALSLLTVKTNPSFGLRQLFKAFQICPIFPLQAGFYQTLWHYNRIYFMELLNKLAHTIFSEK